jgi:hypothetical protein
MRLAPTDSNLTLRGRFSSLEGRFGLDYNQDGVHAAARWQVFEPVACNCVIIHAQV